MNHKKYGFMNIESNLRVRNYETNKKTEILVNNFNWKSNKWLSKLGIENHFEGLVKAVNYKANKTVKYKNEKTNSELHPVLGYFAKLGLSKNDIINKNVQTLTPRLLLRYAPGHMRAAESGRLSYNNLFSINKVNELDIVENGLSASIGFDYKKNQLDKDNNINTDVMSFSLGQVISGKENMDIPSSTSLDQKFSDVVGKSKYYINDKVNLNYNFSIDQSYKNFNYNEVGVDFIAKKVKFNLDYLQEKNHIGNQKFVQSGLDFKLNSFTELSFSSKRNLLTSSAEFYNLSYNYINDCLKAGIGYRREFYTDRDIEPTNTLMFTISIIPFAKINSPSLSR
jgi:LPS-assembly protein